MSERWPSAPSESFPCGGGVRRREDFVIHELNLARLGKNLAAALELHPPPCQQGFLQTTIVGAFPQPTRERISKKNISFT